MEGKTKWTCHDGVCELTPPSGGELSELLHDNMEEPITLLESLENEEQEEEEEEDDPFTINLRSSAFDSKVQEKEGTKDKKKRKEWKGRISIYSIPGCKQCKAAKELLHQRGWPYKDIDLEAHPELLSELRDLTSKQTVPQVFFNEVSIIVLQYVLPLFTFSQGSCWGLH